VNKTEEKIRNLKLPQLKILSILAKSRAGVSSSKELGDTTSTASYTLGAMITPLRRIKIKNEILIIPAGRDIDNTVRWQINEKVIKRDTLKRLLIDMKID